MNVSKDNQETEKSDEDSIIAAYEKNVYDLKQLLEISRSLSTRLELPALIESILYITMAQMRVTGVGLFILKNMNSTHFVLENNYSGISIDSSIDYRIPTNSIFVNKLGELAAPCTLEELEQKIPFDETLEILKSLNPSLIVPLILKNRINGILVLGDRIILPDDETHYTEYEKDEISTIASLASIAINNASLIEQSSTDMMTHLKLKYYFFNSLTDKLDIAFAQGKSLAVLMFDIDFFKKFNDTYGHECGDYVLVNVARIIRESVREDDMASRYGGEEFTVMLNDADKDIAISVAERIRKNIESADFVYKDVHMKVTISGGVSVFSVDKNPVLSATTLVNQADHALYISKANGRNRISYYEEDLKQSNESDEAKK